MTTNRDNTQNKPDSADQSGETGEPEVLLFETSPYGTLDAIVQHDGRAVYFYLNQAQQTTAKFGTRACWVRNLKLGPYVLNQDEMRDGISPQLPRTECVHRDPQPLPNPDHLSIVWFEEGNGAALVETVATDDPNQPNTNKTLAVIPPWSGLEGFHGYALECATESPLCWPMPDNPKLETRISAAIEFWNSFGSESKQDPFSELQSRLMAHYDSRFGSQPPTSQTEQKYFAIDGGQFPPRGMAQYQVDGSVILTTVGMSLCPQPAVEIFTDDPQRQRRIELAIKIPPQLAGDAALIETAGQKISSLAGYPWRSFTWMGAGHTCGLEGIFPNCKTAALVHDTQFSENGSSAIMQESFRGDPVNLLWLIPITDAQKQQLEDNSISINELL